MKLVRLRPYSLASLRFGRHLRLVNLIRSARFDLVHLHEYLENQFLRTYPKVMRFHNNPLDVQDHVEFINQAPKYGRRSEKAQLRSPLAILSKSGYGWRIRELGRMRK